ncbi:hypothetical protein AOLI_G00071880 [Acnodon oligacanthus]
MSNLKCDNILKLSPHVANDFPTTKGLPLNASASVIRITGPGEIKDEPGGGKEVWRSLGLDNGRTFSKHMLFTPPILLSCFLLNTHKLSRNIEPQPGRLLETNPFRGMAMWAI